MAPNTPAFNYRREHTMDHTAINDPYFRRLRKALRRAEEFVGSSGFSEKARGRWNKVINRAKRLGAV